MEDFRSNSQIDTKSQLEINGNRNFRSYSTNYASSSSSSSYSGNGKTEITVAEGGGGGGDPRKVLKKGRSIGGLNDPELQRMRRVASYKVYAVEGKLKGSIKKSFRFFKDKCNQMLYGHK